MVQSIVLDASVALKWFLKEKDGRKKALKIRREILSGKTSVFVPQIFFFEVMNVLKTKADAELEQVFEAIKLLYTLELNTEVVSKEVLSRAVELSQIYTLSVYDASYLSLAKTLGVHFLTADRKLKAKVGLSFIRVLC